MPLISRMNVPLLDLNFQYAPLRTQILAAIAEVCDAHQFILGPQVQQLEEALARTIGAAHAVGVSSGTDALLVALMALDVGPGDEVIVPTFSFFATAGSVARLGARPVFVDVDPQTLNIDVDAVKRALSPRTRAVIPVHLFGLCADMDALRAVAADAGIAIVEDAAQAIGSTFRGRAAGTLGTIGCFSFFPTKNLGAFGDAGLVVTDDERLGERVRLLRGHGASPKYYHREIGGNFRLDTIQAAVLQVKLPHLEEWNRLRCANAALYRQLFVEAGLPDRVQLPVEPEGRVHTYHQFVIRVSERDRVRAELARAGVGTEVYYPVPFHRQECFAGLTRNGETFPHADAAVGEVLALPIYPGLMPEQQRYVVRSLAEAIG